MKTIASTPTCNNKASDKCRGFITPPQHPRGGHRTSAGGFYFGIIARLGAIQSKEVATAKKGNIFHGSKIANSLFIRKEDSL